MPDSRNQFLWSFLQIVTYIILVVLGYLAYLMYSRIPDKPAPLTDTNQKNYISNESSGFKNLQMARYGSQSVKRYVEDKKKQNELKEHINRSYEIIKGIQREVRGLLTEEESILKTNIELKTGKNESNESINKAVLKQLETVGDKLNKYKERIKNLNNEYKLSMQPFIDNLENEIKNKIKEIDMFKKERVQMYSKIEYLKGEISTLIDEKSDVFFISGDVNSLKFKDVIKTVYKFNSRKLSHRRTFAMKEGFDKSVFTKEKDLRTEYNFSKRIVALIPFRDKSYYNISNSKSVSTLTIEDTENFWTNPYLVIITK